MPIPQGRKPSKQPVKVVESHTDPSDAAHAEVLKFMQALKTADLPEGREALLDTQWIRGEADRGENFYSRPRYTSFETLFAKRYDTDVSGVFGYKELLSVQGLSQGGETKTFRYLIVAFKNRHTGEWKILDSYDDSEGDESFNFEQNASFFGKQLQNTSLTSARENYLTYAHWLFLAGHLMQTKTALAQAEKASARSAPGSSDTVVTAQITDLSNVLNSVVTP